MPRTTTPCSSSSMCCSINLSEELPEGDYICGPRTKAEVVREGRDVTILTLLAHRHHCLKAVQQLKQRVDVGR